MNIHKYYGLTKEIPQTCCTLNNKKSYIDLLYKFGILNIEDDIKIRIALLNKFYFHIIDHKIFKFDKNTWRKIARLYTNIAIIHCCKEYPFINNMETIDNIIHFKNNKILFIRDYNGNKSINFDNIDRLNELKKLTKIYKHIKNIPGFVPNTNKEHYMFLGWNEEQAIYKTKAVIPIYIEHWINKGFSEEEAKIKRSEFQRKNSLLFTNKRRDNPEKYKDITPTSLGYWLNKGYSKKEAKLKLKDRQSTFTKDKCIKKYGEELGIIKFNERQIKWQNTLKNKPDYNLIVAKRTNNGLFVSKISQDCFDKIYDKIKDLKDITIYYANLTNEYAKKIPGTDRIVLFDFVIPKLKFAIEFNGGRWHPNIEKFNNDDYNTWKHPFTKESALERIKWDTLKNNVLINENYNLYIIWDSDYLNDKDMIVEKYVKIIKEAYARFNKNEN